MNKIYNARLRGADGLHTICIGDDGNIASITGQASFVAGSGAGPGQASFVAGSGAGPGDAGDGIGVGVGAGDIDAGGHLAVPPFVDPHVHLDAVLSAAALPRPNASGTLIEAIGIWNEWSQTLTEDVLLDNARKAMRWYVANGVLFVRTHADCTDRSMKTVRALVRLREEMRGIVDIQVVAFPQNGVYTAPDGVKLLHEALDIGADVVGGAPHLELTREDGVRAVEAAYDAAEERGLLIDIHCDETGDAQSRFVEVMAKESIVRGMQGRAAASHTTAMHNYDNDYAFKLIGILAKAGMHMVSNPFDNAVLQNRRDGYPRRRGVTRVDELLAGGVNVCLGHDSIMDPWYSMGKGSMVMAANLFAHLGHMSGHAQMTELMDMVSGNAAKAMGLAGYGIAAGNPADIVILDADSDAETVRLMPECLYVLRRGKVVCRTAPATRAVTAFGAEELVDFKA